MSIIPKKRSSSKRGSTAHHAKGRQKNSHDLVDLRERLCNDGETGPAERLSLPEAMITSLRGILLDCDPKWIRKDFLPVPVRDNPTKFYTAFVRELLARHPVLSRAEVRLSGQGLHIIIWFRDPVEFKNEGDRQRWAAIVKVIQRTLPTDPHCPGITALTRPLGSINSKNGITVRRLRKGKPVGSQDVVELFDQVRRGPFRTLAGILLGSELTEPCPVCGNPGSKLKALDFIGKCYNCGDVKLGKLFDVFVTTEQTKAKKSHKS
jgi:hypothetical protein